MLTRATPETFVELSVVGLAVILVLTFFGSLMGYSWGTWFWHDLVGLL